MLMKHSNSAGFTLLELMIALAIAALLASLAAPSFKATIQNNRMATQSNDLLAALSIARSEAISRGASSSVCKSNDNQDNSPSCGGNWNDGWIVFIDDNADGDIDAEDEVIRVYSSLSGGNSLNFAFNHVTYASDALATGFTGVFTLCDARGDSDSSGLVVSSTGRIRQAVAGDTLQACP